MAAGKVKIQPDGSGDDIDNVVVKDAGNLDVFRQVITLGGKVFAAIADVINQGPNGAEYGLVTRNIPSGTQAASLLGNDPGVVAITTALGAAAAPDVTDRAGRLVGHVSVDSLPATAATAAKQDTQIASAASIDGKTVHVDTGAVVVASSALPAGAAVSSMQTTANNLLTSLDGKTVHVDTGAVVVAGSALPAGASTAANQATEIASLASIDGKTVHVDTGAVVVAGSALPTGASTAANQTTEITKLTSLDTHLTKCDTDNVTVIACALPPGASTLAAQTIGNASAASIDGKTVHVDTGAVTVAASALPAGASTAANQATQQATLNSLDGKVTACNTGAVVVAGSALPTGAATAANQATEIANQVTELASLASLDSHLIKCDTDHVLVTACALPAGASTAALQTSGNASLTSLDGKVTACNTGAVTVAASALPAGASTSAAQTTAQTSLGNIDTNTSGAKTNLDTLLTSLAAIGATLAAKTLLVAGVGQDTAPAQVVAGKQQTPWLSRVGTIFSALTDATGSAVVAIKAASTAAAFTDPALTVDVRPGGVLPATATPADGAAYGSLSKIRALLVASNGVTDDLVRSGQTVPTATLTGFLNDLVWAIFHTTPTTRTTGQGGPLEADASGNLRIAEMYGPAYENNPDAAAMTCETAVSSATGAWTRTSSVSGGNATAGVQIKASAGRLRRLRVNNANVTTGFYMQVFDATSISSGVTQSVDRCWVPPHSASDVLPYVELDYPGGMVMSTGIVIAASSTIDVFTSIAGKDSYTKTEWK